MSEKFKEIPVGLINFYQKYLSFDNGLLRILAPSGACRFYPTCSEYTKQVVIKHGVMKGGWLGLKRFLSCNPWTT